MKKKALESVRLKALFPETPPAFTAFVQKNLDDLKAGKETPVMKKKLSLGFALAIALSLLLAAVAVAAMLSPTAKIFGFLYGKDKQERLEKGDIATLGEMHAFSDLEVILEDIVYQADGGMPGLYGTGIISAKEGSGIVLMPEEYSPGDPAGYLLYQGPEEEVPEDAHSYLELAEEQRAKLLRVSMRVQGLSSAGEALAVDTGYSHLPQPENKVRFAFEMSGAEITRATEYNLTLKLRYHQLDGEGEQTSEMTADSWDVRVVPLLSGTAKREIAAQTPPPAPTTTPVPAPGTLMMVGNHWNAHEKYMVAYPEREAVNIQLEYGEWYDYIRNPENQ